MALDQAQRLAASRWQAAASGGPPPQIWAKLSFSNAGLTHMMISCLLSLLTSIKVHTI